MVAENSVFTSPKGLREPSKAHRRLSIAIVGLRTPGRLVQSVWIESCTTGAELTPNRRIRRNQGRWRSRCVSTAASSHLPDARRLTWTWRAWLAIQ